MMTGTPHGMTGAMPSAGQVARAVIESNPEVRDRILAMIPEGALSFGSLEELARLARTGVAVVAVLGPSCAEEHELLAAEDLTAGSRSVGTILLTEELTTTLLQRALRAGVRDVLALTWEPTTLATAIERVAVTLEAAPAPRGPGTPTAGAPMAPGIGDGPIEEGRVITVFSTKGGAGRSVLATNLAVALAQRSERPVCLLDADLQFGDVAVMLHVTPTHTVADAVRSIDRLDAAMLDGLLCTHQPTGLRVLPAPLEPSFADGVTSSDMVSIVDTLRSFCGFVVIDTPAYFNDVVLGLVEASDQVLMLAGLDVPNVKNLKIGLHTLRLLNTPSEKLRLVLNRANSKVKLDVGEVERSLGMRADTLIPSDVAVPQSVNRGEPIVTAAPRSSVARAIVGLAETYLPAAQQDRRRR